MRIILVIFISFLSFQSFPKANDIREFEIEGISIGDSLLNYSSKQSIKNEIDNKDNSVYYETNMSVL